MKITIDEDVIAKKGMDVPSFLAAFCIKAGVDISKTLLQLISNNRILIRDGNLCVSQRLNDDLDSIILSGDTQIPNEKELKELAKLLMTLVPSGKMPDSPYFYKGNASEVCLSLQKFYKIYNIDCTFDDIIDAVSRYVRGFYGVYTYMKSLKNFIYHIDIETGEITSDLAAYIEALKNGKTE